jgi:hypothetical protein
MGRNDDVPKIVSEQHNDGDIAQPWVSVISDDGLETLHRGLPSTRFDLPLPFCQEHV